MEMVLSKSVSKVNLGLVSIAWRRLETILFGLHEVINIRKIKAILFILLKSKFTERMYSLFSKTH
jgi:hypothetical protein